MGSTGQALVDLDEGANAGTAGALEGVTDGREDWEGEGTGSAFHQPIFPFSIEFLAAVEMRLGAAVML